MSAPYQQRKQRPYLRWFVTSYRWKKVHEFGAFLVEKDSSIKANTPEAFYYFEAKVAS